jgi:hypothetical protein
MRPPTAVIAEDEPHLREELREALHKTLAGTLEIRLRKRSELLPVSAPHAHLFKQM